MNILIRSADGQEVFGGVKRIESMDSPEAARNRIRVIDAETNAEQIFDLNKDHIELLPENHA